jgi:DNA-binding NtrC family response regulator
MNSTSKRVLFSWIGHADLTDFADVCPADQQRRIRSITKNKQNMSGHPGPLKTLVLKEQFHEIHVLTNEDQSIVEGLDRWLNRDCRVHHAKLKNTDVTNYKAVFRCVDNILREHGPGKDAELCFHLSSGTPTMAATWILLGKSKYPARFFQTYEGSAREEIVPFDLRLEWMPEVLADADRTLEAAQSQFTDRMIGDVHDKKSAFLLDAQRFAKRAVNVLIEGESGTGKERLARYMHDLSERRDKEMITINCGAIPESLIEAELFGYEKGAFTGAQKEKRGIFEIANGSTLFLDEIGECSSAVQVRLLRALQPVNNDSLTCRRTTRIGGSTERKSDVRIIAATNRKLMTEIRAGRFREDLYYRLNSFSVRIPPLRERRHEIRMISGEILEHLNSELSKSEPGFTPRQLSAEALRKIEAGTWPGNIRELQSAILRAMIKSDHVVLKASDLDVETHLAESSETQQILPEGSTLKAHVQAIERSVIAATLTKCGGNKEKARIELGLKSRQAFDLKIKQHSLGSLISGSRSSKLKSV